MSNLKIKEKGKYVSRAAFAKLQGEKNRLLKDIRTMVMSKDFAEIVLVKDKYRKQFEQLNWLGDALREMAQEQLKPKLDSNPKAFK